MSNPCPILLINLDSSRDRLNSALVKLKEAGLSAERISAVDGRLLTEEERKLITIWDKSAFFKPLSPGEIGCYLSHIAAAEHIVKEGWPMAVVLEDDFKLHPDFKKHLTEIINFSNQLPDMVKLEGGLKGKEAVLKLTPEVSLVRYRRPPANTLAHLWTLAGAKKVFIYRSSLASSNRCTVKTLVGG
jgi:glycosyl transferase family 25